MRLTVFARGSGAGPAAEGALMRAARGGARTIILGALAEPRPWAEEVLAVRARGVRVIVCAEASAFALELACVEPVGEVASAALASAARDGGLDLDDRLHYPAEVAPEDAWMPLDLELADGAPQALIEAHRAQPPRRRSLVRAAEIAGVMLPIDAARPSARDLVLALERASTPVDLDPVAARPTLHLERLEHQGWMQDNLQSVPGRPGLETQTAAGETYAVSRKKILLHLLARGEARQVGIEVTPAAVAELTADWRRRFGFTRATELQTFLEARGVSVAEFFEVMEDFTRVETLERAFGPQIEAAMNAHVAIQSARTRAEPSDPTEGS